MKKLILTISIIFFSCPVLSNTFTKTISTDRITGKSSYQHLLIFDMGQLNGQDFPCKLSSKCEMTIGENSIYLNGYSILSVDRSGVKDTKVRIRIGNDIYNGSCEYASTGHGCYISFRNLIFNSFDIKKVINQILSTKGYIAIEVRQEFNRKDIETINSVWFTNID